MPSDRQPGRARAGTTAGWPLKAGALAAILFLHVPLAFIVLYAFSSESKSFVFPPPGLTTRWFGVAFEREDIRQALALSLRVGAASTAVAMVLGTLAAAAIWRSRFFGREGISLLLILPIALPGVITGISLRSAIGLLDIPFSFWTIVIGHATFCVVVVYNNVVARLRRMPARLIEASMDLGADTLTTLRHVVLPQLGTALLAGGILAFALSVDELIVTTFTAGSERTLPLWLLNQLSRPREVAITNVVALIVMLITMPLILLAWRLTRETEATPHTR